MTTINYHRSHVKGTSNEQNGALYRACKEDGFTKKGFDYFGLRFEDAAHYDLSDTIGMRAIIARKNNCP